MEEARRTEDLLNAAADRPRQMNSQTHGLTG